jgi:hypothetical protein
MFAIRSSTVTVLLMLGSVLLNVALATTLYRIGDAPAAAQAAAAPAAPVPLHPGEDVGQLTGVTLEGKPFTLRYEGEKRPTLIYSYSKNCRWSRNNLPLVQGLFESAAGRVRFVWVSVDYEPEPPFAAGTNKAEGIGPVLGTFAAGTVREFSFGPTPLVTVVAPNGKILGQWLGLWTPDIQNQISSVLKNAIH